MELEINRDLDFESRGSVMKVVKRKKVKKTLRKSVKRGSGLVNKLIDKLPFELHLPGYNYCGPGMFCDIIKEKKYECML